MFTIIIALSFAVGMAIVAKAHRRARLLEESEQLQLRLTRFL